MPTGQEHFGRKNALVSSLLLILNLVTLLLNLNT